VTAETDKSAGAILAPCPCATFTPSLIFITAHDTHDLRTAIATAAPIAFANAPPAQEVSGRIDLEAVAPLARLVTARVAFAKNDVA
jgi:hypothetical protein